ncbi:hypothetical protein C8R44DRAFT_351043 [Mycena epipterygia]|nr:hypothetical protein C8R44DRAFT_351043 [Mycena epipterygia]
MREAAESAKDLFNLKSTTAVDATAAAPQAIKIKNKVLKLAGEVQRITFKIAQSAAGSLCDRCKKAKATMAAKITAAAAVRPPQQQQARNRLQRWRSQRPRADVSVCATARRAAPDLGRRGMRRRGAFGVYRFPADLSTVAFTLMENLGTMREAESVETGGSESQMDVASAAGIVAPPSK